MKPRTRVWTVNKYSNIKAKRRGYLLTADFGSTSHMIQGQTLSAAFWGAQDASGVVTGAQQIGGYVALSRVKTADSMYILQPFSDRLFQRGPPKGPDLLLRCLEKELSGEELIEDHVFFLTQVESGCFFITCKGLVFWA